MVMVIVTTYSYMHVPGTCPARGRLVCRQCPEGQHWSPPPDPGCHTDGASGSLESHGP